MAHTVVLTETNGIISAYNFSTKPESDEFLKTLESSKHSSAIQYDDVGNVEGEWTPTENTTAVIIPTPELISEPENTMTVVTPEVVEEIKVETPTESAE